MRNALILMSVLILLKAKYLFHDILICFYFCSVDGEIKESKRPKLVKLKPVTTDIVNEKPCNTRASNIFFLALFWGIGVVCIVKNVWILELLTIPFLIYLIKKLVAWNGADIVLHKHFESTRLKVKMWAKERKDVLSPAPVRGIMRTVLLGDKKVEGYMHAI